ncbi:MAG: carboxypeptidase regulatory-like domain-containing protein, partial [Alistipes sp.]|nr:carboxypeptidase regulatory-like domain-containing protein [Alistipes sp.]
MKRILITLLFICITAVSYAQNSKVTLTVIDAATQEGVAGAVVAVAPAAEPDNEDKTKYYTSGFGGETSITGLKRGEYKLKISFLGYATKVVDLKANAATVALGKIALEEEATKIETVVKTVQAIRASQKGDTVAYNADAFKVANDADVEGLLKKMPGITVTDGQVEAQGETVKKILVDGKEFFGEDVSTALNSLPAQSVKSVEVFNKLSDNAEFSGVDDGESYKAINIVTHENMRQGVFGKVYAGYGYQPDTDDITNEHKYMLGGNVNYFHGSSRISLIGLLNNINQQNFSFEDILGVDGDGGGGMRRPQRGLANVGSIGLNYSDSWGEKEKVKLQASYFYNNTRTRNLNEIIKWYEAPLEELGTLEQSGNSDNRNYNHRLNARLDWR